MNQHFNVDAERIAAVKKVRKYISIILFITVSMLAFTLYQLLF